ncbi:MAG: hypothetical protein PHC64_09095 [Candidatus Gastranaerophilales bacterium]|nr:hypothetical protein [Candidatus Gastranaerophilales bacterium]
MGKKAKIGRLREKIAIKIERVACLLDNIIFSADNEIEKDILAGIAYDEVKRMDRFNEKIHKYL